MSFGTPSAPMNTIALSRIDPPAATGTPSLIWSTCETSTFPYQSPFGYAAESSLSPSAETVTGTRTRILVPERSDTATSAAYSPPSGAICVVSTERTICRDSPGASSKSCVSNGTHFEAEVPVAFRNICIGGTLSPASSPGARLTRSVRFVRPAFAISIDWSGTPALNARAPDELGTVTLTTPGQSATESPSKA